MLADSMIAPRSIYGNLGAFRSMGSSRAYYASCGVRGRAAHRRTDDDKSEQLLKYAPKRLREQPRNLAASPLRSSSPPVSPSHAQAQDDRQEALPSIVRGWESCADGVTENEIRLGISAPFSGAAKELGQNMKLGIDAAFNVANENGGIHGRQLRLVVADDRYEPTRTAETMKQLYDQDRVFGIVGNVGTPTAVVALLPGSPQSRALAALDANRRLGRGPVAHREHRALAIKRKRLRTKRAAKEAAVARDR